MGLRDNDEQRHMGPAKLQATTKQNVSYEN